MGKACFCSKTAASAVLMPHISMQAAIAFQSLSPCNFHVLHSCRCLLPVILILELRVRLSERW
uniref:Uncharacterized protein n=1 Tax=Arundo donax TaxID=35708 RepID=A0A0A8YC67_ARUDO